MSNGKEMIIRVEMFCSKCGRALAVLALPTSTNMIVGSLMDTRSGCCNDFVVRIIRPWEAASAFQPSSYGYADHKTWNEPESAPKPGEWRAAVKKNGDIDASFAMAGGKLDTAPAKKKSRVRLPIK